MNVFSYKTIQLAGAVIVSLSFLPGCLSLSASAPALTNAPTTYLARIGNNVTLNVTIPEDGDYEGNCTLKGSKEGIIGVWPVGSSEFQDTRIVNLTLSSQNYTLTCDQVYRGPNNLNITIEKYPTLAAARANTCNVLCVNGALVATNASCSLAAGTYCAGASCVNSFTGTATEACVGP